MDFAIRLIVTYVKDHAESIVAFLAGMLAFGLLWFTVGRWILRKIQGNKLEDMQKQCNGLIGRNLTLQRQQEAWQLEKMDLQRTLEASRGEAAELGDQAAELTERVRRLEDFDGRVWEDTPAEAPEFLPVADGRPRIICAVNLKGGVGKTTLTANLAAALALLGKRVLLVDLDYQGSLTSLCMPPQTLQGIRHSGEFIDMLLDPQADGQPLARRCARDVPGQAGIRIISAEESLADVENRLLAKWLLQADGPDVRYLLRTHLHSPPLRGEYEYVMLDCPPRMTAACVNALAASDYVLVPVIPDPVSAEAVPRLLQTLLNLKSKVCPDLKLLGVVGNKASPRAELVQREEAVWKALPGECQVVWGTPVHHYRTIIRQKAAFPEAAARHRFAIENAAVRTMFQDLASEIEKRV